MQSQRPVKKISLESLLDDDNAGDRYAHTYTEATLIRPLAFLGFSRTITHSVSVKPVKVPEKDEQVVFEYQTDSDATVQRQGMIQFPRYKLLNALAAPTPLENGRQGVYLSNIKWFFVPPRSGNALDYMLSLLYSYKLGEESVALIFDANNRLESIKIADKYDGHEINLFVGKSLESDRNKSNKLQQIQAEKEAAAKYQAATRVFNF